MSNLVINGHIINAPIKDILYAIKKELINGKLRVIEDVKNDNITVTCPFHKLGKESHPSSQIYCGDSPDIEYGTFHCFTCGESGPLYHFVGECFDEGDEFGKQWLLTHFGNALLENQFNALFQWDEQKPKEYIDESVLNNFEDWHPYMAKRKLSPAVCKYFQIKYDPVSECLVFPVRDETGKIYMLTRRSVNTKQFIIDADKDKPVYLLNEITKKGINEVVVVESQINCLTLWTYGIPSVALFGTGAKNQYKALNKSEIKHYFLCFDGDSAGKNGIKKFLKNIRDDVIVDIYEMPDGMDVNDLTQEEFDNLPILSSFEWLRKNNNESKN